MTCMLITVLSKYKSASSHLAFYVERRVVASACAITCRKLEMNEILYFLIPKRQSRAEHGDWEAYIYVGILYITYYL
jgi:hypothetical protein